MHQAFLWLASFAVIVCPSVFAQQDAAAISEDCRIQLGSQRLLSPDYFQAVTFYRRGKHTAAVDELLRASTDSVEKTIEELEHLLESSQSRHSSPSDRCLQAAAMMHSEAEMLYAVKQDWATSEFHHESALKIVETDINDELEKVFRNVLLEIETRYLLTYRVPNGTEEGWHDIKVELEKHKAAIRARSGFYYEK